MIKTPDHPNQPISQTHSVREQKEACDLLNNGVANGVYGNAPGLLMLAARKNPYQDWNVPLKEVLTTRTIDVGNRAYATCLVGIPLHGDLGLAFEHILSIKEILRGAQEAKLMSKDDGLILLDQPLPRSTIQLMSVEDMYNLTPRLFERGVRGSPIPVLDARITESDQSDIDSAMMIGLVYWKEGRAAPRLLTDPSAQMQIAEIVKRQVVFERVTRFCRQPVIQSNRMEPFLEATISSSRHIIKRYLNRLFANSGIETDGATFNVVTSSAPWGQYQIEIVLQASGRSGDQKATFDLDDLRDGNVCDTMDFLVNEVRARGALEIHVTFQQTNDFAARDTDTATSPIFLH